MRTIQVDSGPPLPCYDTFEEAIAGAKAHPLQGRARTTSRLLEGTHVAGGSWTLAACEITFSNGRCLYVEARDFQDHWEV